MGLAWSGIWVALNMGKTNGKEMSEIMALTTKQIAEEYVRRYRLNIAEAMQNAKIDNENFGPFHSTKEINAFFDEMERLGDELHKDD